MLRNRHPLTARTDLRGRFLRRRLGRIAVSSWARMIGGNQDALRAATHEALPQSHGPIVWTDVLIWALAVDRSGAPWAVHDALRSDMRYGVRYLPSLGVRPLVIGNDKYPQQQQKAEKSKYSHGQAVQLANACLLRPPYATARYGSGKSLTKFGNSDHATSNLYWQHRHRLH